MKNIINMIIWKIWNVKIRLNMWEDPNNFFLSFPIKESTELLTL